MLFIYGDESVCYCFRYMYLNSHVTPVGLGGMMPAGGGGGIETAFSSE